MADANKDKNAAGGETRSTAATVGVFKHSRFQASKLKNIGKHKKIILLLVIVFLAAGTAFIYVQNQRSKRSQNEAADRVQQVLTEEERLESHIKESTVRYQDFRTLSEEELRQKTQGYAE